MTSMNTTIGISTKRRSQSFWLISILILLPFALGTLNDLLGLPHAVRYLCDLAWMSLLCLLFLNASRFKAAGTKSLAVWIMLFLWYTSLVYIVQFQSPLYYLWGARNNFRFYVMFFGIAAFMNRRPQLAIISCLTEFSG